MIKRTSSNKATPSLVNAANEEHLNVTKGIRDDKPITDLVSVFSSINFDAADDGSYVLRNPVVLKNRISLTSFYLFDKKTLFKYEPDANTGAKKLTIATENIVKLRWHDASLIEHEKVMTEINFITRVFNHINTVDGTVVAIQLNHDTFKTWSADGSVTYPLVYEDLNYNNLLYRLLKIYKDPDEVEQDVWIIEIVHPELNSIVSATDTSNAESLDINMLLDNPYAIRDLYNTGSNSTTKILAYKYKGASAGDTFAENLTVEQLTEGFAPHTGASDTRELKLIVSDDTVNGFSTDTIYFLKAFIRTAKISGEHQFYCCWEYSLNGGVDWQVVPAFKDQWAGQLVSKYVSELDAKEFEDVAYRESLEEASNYIFSKDMVPWDPDMTESQGVNERPDILKVRSGELNYLYRFQVYVDTNKQSPIGDVTEENVAKSSFSDLALSAPANIDIDGNFTYQSHTAGGATASSLSITDNNKTLYQYKKVTLKIVNNRPTITITTTKVNLGVDYFTNPPSPTTIGRRKPSPVQYILKTFGGTSYYDGTKRLGTSCTLTTTTVYVGTTAVTAIILNSGTANYLVGLNGVSAIESTTGNVVGTVVAGTSVDPTLDTIKAAIQLHSGQDGNVGNAIVIKGLKATNKITHIKITLNETASTGGNFVIGFNGVNKPNKIAIDSLDNVATISANDTATYEVFNTDVVTVYNAGSETLNIKKIEVFYEKSSGKIKTTSTYLASQTGSYQIPYSVNEELVPDLSKQREFLFTGKWIYYKDQLVSFAGYNVFFSEPDSTIFKINKVLTFGNKVTKVLTWRSYLIIFTESDISLAQYNYESNQYSIKLLTTTTGISEADAETAVVILNSIYFKSHSKVYRLVPNLYASTDDILNLYVVSDGINTILEDLTTSILETHNFQYSDVENYYIFVPLEKETYCFKFNYERKIWTISKFPIKFVELEYVSIYEAYLRTPDGMYHFKEDPKSILRKTILTKKKPLGGYGYGEVLATSISLNANTITLNPNGTYKLTAAVHPDDATTRTVTWSTNDASVASVDSKGNVTAGSVGSATITASVSGTTVSTTCVVTVRSPVYQLVTKANKDEMLTGEGQYLIVAEDGDVPHILNGTLPNSSIDSTSNYITGEFDSNRNIKLTTEIENAEFSIDFDVASDKIVIRSKDGRSLGNNSNSNGLRLDSYTYLHQIVDDTYESSQICLKCIKTTSGLTSNTFLKVNHSSGQDHRIRYLGSLLNYKPAHLYKRVDVSEYAETACYEPLSQAAMVDLTTNAELSDNVSYILVQNGHIIDVSRPSLELTWELSNTPHLMENLTGSNLAVSETSIIHEFQISHLTTANLNLLNQQGIQLFKKTTIPVVIPRAASPAGFTPSGEYTPYESTPTHTYVKSFIGKKVEKTNLNRFRELDTLIPIYRISKTDMDIYYLYEQLPYADYITKMPVEIANIVEERMEEAESIEIFKDLYTEIPFNIDFGQKSSNYTLDKQYLESKLVFATYQSKDTFPITLDIETDGETMSFVNKRIHIDPVTSAALWKTSNNEVGSLNTEFEFNDNTNHSGIMRQLIVKYSGKGKTIRHVLSGVSHTKFKFYSMDIRSRILPKKQ